MGPRTEATPGWVRVLSAPAMVLIGSLVAIQSLINGQLAITLGTGLRAKSLAALISFGGGLLLLSVLAASHRGTRRGVAELADLLRNRQVPVRATLGGLFGAVLVASQGISASTLGVALFIVCVVAGQSSMALVVDHLGWGPSGRSAISAARATGAALAVTAAALSAIQAGSSARGWSIALLMLAVLPFLAGAGTSVQQAMNGRLALRIGSWATTWNNFVVGFTGLLVLFAVSLLLPGRIAQAPTNPLLYLGGPIGICFIYLSSALVRIHGVLVLGLCTIAGQIVTALVIDLIVHPEELGTLSWVAAALTLVGVSVALLPVLLRRRAAIG